MTSHSLPFPSSSDAESVTRGRCWTDPGLDSALDAVSFTATASEAMAVAEAHCARVAGDPERLGLAVPALAQACAAEADRAKTLDLCEELAEKPALVSGHALALFAQMCRDWAWVSRGEGLASSVSEAAGAEFDRAIDLSLRLAQHAVRDHQHVAGWATMIGALTDTEGHSVEVNTCAMSAHEQLGFATPLVQQYSRTLEPRWGGNQEKHFAYCVTVAEAHPYSYGATMLPQAVLGYSFGVFDHSLQRGPTVFRMAKALMRFSQLNRQHKALLELCSDAALARVQSVGDELLSHRTHQMWAHYFGGVAGGNDARRDAHAAHMGNRYHATYNDMGLTFEDFAELRAKVAAA